MENVPTIWESQIDVDLKRTHPDCSNKETVLAMARNVLIAYARRNPMIGYCQGLNFIAAFILQ